MSHSNRVLTICDIGLGHYSQLTNSPHQTTVSRSVLVMKSFTHLVSQGAVDTSEIDPSVPAASSTGPQRRRRTGGPSRKPTAQEKASLKKEGWSQTLVRFQAQFEAFLDGPDGQPAGGLTPEMALAQVSKIAKDDLKNTVSGFFTGFSFIVSLICQPGGSRSGIRRPEREDVDLGVQRNI